MNYWLKMRKQTLAFTIKVVRRDQSSTKIILDEVAAHSIRYNDNHDGFVIQTQYNPSYFNVINNLVATPNLAASMGYSVRNHDMEIKVSKRGVLREMWALIDLSYTEVISSQGLMLISLTSPYTKTVHSDYIN